MRSQRILAVVTATLMLSGVIIAAPSRPLDVAYLTAAADLVVVGKVLSVRREAPVSFEFFGREMTGTTYLANLKIERVLKGSPNSETVTFTFVLPDSPIGFQSARPEQYGMFFLKHEGQSLAFVDPVHCCLPAVTTSALRTPDPLDRVTITLGQVLGNAQASDTDNTVVLDALGRIPNTLANEVLKLALKRTGGELKLRVAMTLVARNDISGLALVEQHLMDGNELPRKTFEDAAGSLAGLRDARAIPVLEKLLELQKPEVNQAVVVALRQTGSAAALKPLAQLLNDDNDVVKYSAVAGLGEITKQDEWTPSFDTFQQNPTRYVAYWRQWVAANVR